MAEKSCSDCGVVQPLDRFHKKRVGADGEQQYQAYCRKCGLERYQVWRAANRDKVLAKERDYWRRVKRDAVRERKYGVTREMFDGMLGEQNFSCAICVQPFADPEAAHVDHCHTTGRVRGLLCDWCNRAIGLLHDDPDRLRRAAKYLEDQ